MKGLEDQEDALSAAGGRGGFNMVELLTTVVVLTIVVTISAAIFRGVTAAWDEGTGRQDTDLAGRTALDMLTADLENAVADFLLAFAMDEDRYGIASYGLTNSEVAFIALDRYESDTNRSVRQIIYWVREATNSPGRWELVRGRRLVSKDELPGCSEQWYTDPPPGRGHPESPGECGVVAENVATFRLTAPDFSNTVSRSYYSMDDGDRLPRHVDVYLEILPEPIALQAADLTSKGLDPAELIEKNARRFTTRVHFTNRNGYESR